MQIRNEQDFLSLINSLLLLSLATPAFIYDYSPAARGKKKVSRDGTGKN